VNSQLVARTLRIKLSFLGVAVDHFQGYPRNFLFYDRLLLGVVKPGGPKPPTDTDYSTPVSKTIFKPPVMLIGRTKVSSRAFGPPHFL